MAADGVNLANAYIQLIPTVQGVQGAVAKALIPGEKEADAAGKKQGGLFAGGFKSVAAKAALGVTAVGAAAGLTGKFLYDVGSTFDDVTDTIRVGTGASGDALKGLTDVAKNVGKTVPASFEDAGTVVADLNTRLGLSGKTLETVASQYIQAGNILGEDVDIASTSAAFNAFGIEGEAVSGAMDDLFRISQATGLSMNELASSTSKNAAPLKNLGFSFQDTAAMTGALDKAGVNASQVMASMSKGLVELAKDGEEPQEAFKRVTAEIQGLVDKGETASAIDMASGVFGTRGASSFVGALQSGKLNMDDLMGATGATKDTILGLGEETMDFPEKWQIFKNKGLAAIEPIGTAVFGLGSVLMDRLMPVLDEVAGGITAFGAAWTFNDGEITSSGFPGFMERVGYAARQAFDYLRDPVLPTLRSFGQFLVDNKNALAVLAGGLLTYKTITLGVTAAQKIAVTWTKLQTLAQKGLNSAFRANPIGIVVTALTALVAGVVLAYNNIGWFKDGVDAAWARIKVATGWLIDVFKNLGTNTKAEFTAIKAAVLAVGAWFAGPFWNGMKAVIGWVVDGFKRLWSNTVREWNAIRAAISAVGQWFTGVLFPAFRNAGQWIANAFNRLMANTRREWNTIKASIKAVSDWFGNVLVPWFRGRIQNVIDKFLTMRNSVRDVWNNVRDKITGVWGHIKSKAFDPMVKFVRETIPAAFRASRDGIGKIWDGLKGVVKAPVKFVIQDVINGALIGGYNKLNNFWSGKDISPIPLPKGFRKGGYTGDIDKNAVAGVVHGREHVTRAESTADFNRKAPGFLDAANKHGVAALEQYAPQFAPGSPTYGRSSFVGPQFNRNFQEREVYFGGDGAAKSHWFLNQAINAWNGLAGIKLKMGFNPSKPYVHARESSYIPGGAGIPNWAGYYSGSQVVFNPASRGMAPMARRAVAIHEIGHALGLPHAHVGEGGNGAWSIMNYDNMYRHNSVTAADAAALRSIYPGAATRQPGGLGDPGDGGQSLLGTLKDVIVSPFTKLLDQAKSKFTNNGWLDMPLGLAKAAKDGLLEHAMDKLKALPDFVNDVVGKVKDLFSGAGIAHGAHLSPMLHDNGGWLKPGMTLVNNASGKPEPVLSSSQWEKVERGLATSEGQGSMVLQIENMFGTPKEIVNEVERRKRRANYRAGVRGIGKVAIG